ncbi:hypothetical protein CPB84DRAFT_826867 [Gymnopilus junonius]|uniref:Uncharacterized protein n=1 Tax=Gymnopilus junonius TaxID=109634 RepID=A0A9P5TFF4_GYMJU|nr:hypothetical protein CPB84DRAFT_826867 [Gymnopilus junonius]
MTFERFSLKFLLLWLLLIVNCSLSLLTLTMRQRSCTYLDDDYPIEAPIDHLDWVAMTMFEGTHFQLNASDHVSDKEWRTIYSGPYTLHLGSEKRIFLIALYHETHCLRAMEYVFLHPESSAYTPQHIQHCLNYLRQHFLCVADDQLEEDDFLHWDLRTGSVYVDDKLCRGWDRVSTAASDDLRRFRDLRGRVQLNNLI